MKLKAAQVETFLRSPDAKAQLILIYGEDEGLVRERAVRLVALAEAEHGCHVLHSHGFLS